MGRKAKVFSAEILGPLTPEDLLEREVQPEGQSTAPPLQRVRANHHNLAKLLASGMPEGEAAIVCGYSISRVSILKADPAFQELLHFYAAKKDALFQDVMGMVSGLAVDAILEVRERLESDPGRVSTKDLLELLNTSLDRLGYKPAERHVHVHTSTTIDALRAAAEAARATSVVYVDQEGPESEEHRALLESVAEDPFEGLSPEGFDVSEEGHRVLEEEPTDGEVVPLPVVPV